MAQTKNKEYSKASICIISIGGTIASIAKGREDGVFPALKGSDIVQSVPGLEERMSIRIESPYTVPSNQLTFDHLLSLYQSLIEIAESDPEVGFVITTGTDTLEESAYFIDLLYNYPNPIIFTGAMRAPSQICPDGPRNLQDAALAAASPLCSELGVLVVMNGEIHVARDVTKTHSTDVAAFRSPMLGPLGMIHGEKVIMRRRPFRREWIDTRKAANCVELIRCVLGDSGRSMNALIDSEVEGFVVESFGGGHVPPAVRKGIFRALEKGVPVVVTTRCPEGEMLVDTYRYQGSEMDLRSLGTLFIGAMSGTKARIRLALCLGAGMQGKQLARYFPD